MCVDPPPPSLRDEVAPALRLLPSLKRVRIDSVKLPCVRREMVSPPPPPPPAWEARIEAESEEEDLPPPPAAELPPPEKMSEKTFYRGQNLVVCNP